MKANWKFVLTVVRIAALAVALPLIFWSCGVFHYLLFRETLFLTALVGIFFLGLWIFGLFFQRAVWILLASQMFVGIYFLCVTPENSFQNVQWQTPWVRRPWAEFDLKEKKITFYDVRDFCYKSENDYQVRYLDMTVSPEELHSLDLAVSHWDGLESVAHTMLCFNFKNQKRLVLSMETRIPVGKKQGAVAGLFKQYEIIPVLGTPEDLFDLRIKHRGEDFYLYRTNTTPEQMRHLLRSVAVYVNLKPEFYNTLTRNCTTSLLPLVEVLALDPIDDFRLVINGFSDQLLFRLGYLHCREGETFASLKSRSYIPGKSAGRIVR